MNVGAFMKALDRLPHGPAWRAVTLKVTEGENSRIVVVYFCNIIEVLRDLIGNTQLKAHMRYAPERHWTSRARRKRVFGEMWTGDWWWRIQVSSSSYPRMSFYLPEVLGAAKRSQSDYRAAHPCV